MQNHLHTDNSQAVEVTAMLGDSVVAVRHLSQERPPKPHWPAFALAAVFGSMAAIAFAKAVSIAASNHAAMASWLDAGQVAHDFRPAHLSLGYDVVALGGLCGAIVAFAIGILRLKHAQGQSTFVMGSGKDADLHCDSAGAAALPVVDFTGAEPVVNVLPGMDADVRQAGDIRPFDEPAQGAAFQQMVVPQEGSLRLSTGLVHLFVSRVDGPRRGVLAKAAESDRRALTFIGASALVHALALALMFSIPPDPSTLSLGAGDADSRLVRVSTSARENPVEEPIEPAESEGGEAGEAAQAKAPPAGETGDPDEKSSKGRFEITKRQASPTLSRHQAIAQARESGILGYFSSGDLFQNPNALSDISSAFGERDLRGGLDGDPGAIAGDYSHSFGVYRGVGDTLGWGTDKSGGFGACKDLENCKIGPGGNKGEDWRGPSGGPQGSGRTSKVPPPTTGRITVKGGLDKAIIRRLVKRKLTRIRHCYEKQLLVAPGLGGTVMASFVIGPNGSVLQSTASGIGDGELEGCVARIVGSIQFPKGGGVANVRYPFSFRSN